MAPAYIFICVSVKLNAALWKCKHQLVMHTSQFVTADQAVNMADTISFDFIILKLKVDG